MNKQRPLSLVILLIFAVSAGLTLTGCRSKKSKRKYKTLQGVIERIDKDGAVAMSWFNEKRGKTMIISAPIREDTEIYIDGKLADLSQVKPGDQVVVEGYKEGTDLHPVRVDVIRTAGKKAKSRKPALPTTRPSPN